MIRPWLAQLSRSVLTGTLAPPLFDPTNPRPAAAAEQWRRKTSKEVQCRRLEADGEPPSTEPPLLGVPMEVDGVDSSDGHSR